ncbi:hypothetical protein ACLOJK_002980 [Asimina triloba]
MSTMHLVHRGLSNPISLLDLEAPSAAVTIGNTSALMEMIGRLMKTSLPEGQFKDQMEETFPMTNAHPEGFIEEQREASLMKEDVYPEGPAIEEVPVTSPKDPADGRQAAADVSMDNPAATAEPCLALVLVPMSIDTDAKTQQAKVQEDQYEDYEAPVPYAREESPDSFSEEDPSEEELEEPMEEERGEGQASPSVAQPEVGEGKAPTFVSALELLIKVISPLQAISPEDSPASQEKAAVPEPEPVPPQPEAPHPPRNQRFKVAAKKVISAPRGRPESMEDPEPTPHPAVAPPATQPMEWETFLQQTYILVDKGLSGLFFPVERCPSSCTSIYIARHKGVQSGQNLQFVEVHSLGWQRPAERLTGASNGSSLCPYQTLRSSRLSNPISLLDLEAPSVVVTIGNASALMEMRGRLMETSLPEGRFEDQMEKTFPMTDAHPEGFTEEQREASPMKEDVYPEGPAIKEVSETSPKDPTNGRQAVADVSKDNPAATIEPCLALVLVPMLIDTDAETQQAKVQENQYEDYEAPIPDAQEESPDSFSEEDPSEEELEEPMEEERGEG